VWLTSPSSCSSSRWMFMIRPFRSALGRPVVFGLFATLVAGSACKTSTTTPGGGVSTTSSGSSSSAVPADGATPQPLCPHQHHRLARHLTAPECVRPARRRPSRFVNERLVVLDRGRCHRARTPVLGQLQLPSENRWRVLRVQVPPPTRSYAHRERLDLYEALRRVEGEFEA
jgi:hypothetical protein